MHNKAVKLRMDGILKDVCDQDSNDSIMAETFRQARPSVARFCRFDPVALPRLPAQLRSLPRPAEGSPALLFLAEELRAWMDRGGEEGSSEWKENGSKGSNYCAEYSARTPACSPTLLLITVN